MPSCLGIHFSDNVIRYAKLVTDSANNVRLDHYGTRIAKGIRTDIVESIIDETYSAEIPVVTNVLNENLVEVSIFDQAQESQYSPDIMKLEFETWCEKNQKTPDKYKYVYKLSDYRTAENKHNGILCISSKDDIEQSTKINDIVAQAAYPSKLLYTDLAPQDVSNYIIVNLDEKLSIETVINRKMFDYKLYAIGIADVLSAVEMKLGNYQRAYAACKQLNVYTEGEDTNDKEVASIVEPILQEILRNIASVVEANKDTISRVYITGMGIIFNNMDVLLTEYLGIKTSILKPKFLSDTSDVRSIAEVLETTQAMVMAYNFLMNKNRFLDYVKRVPEKKKNDFFENIKAKFSSVKFKKKEKKQKEPAENATQNGVSTADQVKEQKKINIKMPEIEKNVALNVMNKEQLQFVSNMIGAYQQTSMETIEPTRKLCRYEENIMQNLFENYLKNGLPEHDSTYLSTYQYVMLLSKNNVIKAYFANVDYTYFIEYPTSDKEYNTPLEVLESEMSLTGCDAGIMYENVNGQFHTIAFVDLKENNRKM